MTHTHHKNRPFHTDNTEVFCRQACRLLNRINRVYGRWRPRKRADISQSFALLCNDISKSSWFHIHQITCSAKLNYVKLSYKIRPLLGKHNSGPKLLACRKLKLTLCLLLACLITWGLFLPRRLTAGTPRVRRPWNDPGRSFFGLLGGVQQPHPHAWTRYM